MKKNRLFYLPRCAKITNGEVQSLAKIFEHLKGLQSVSLNFFGQYIKDCNISDLYLGAGMLVMKG